MKNIFLDRKNKKGLSLVEVIIGSAVIIGGMLALISTMGNFVSSENSSERTIQALLIRDEGIEVVKYLRDVSWSTHIASTEDNVPYEAIFNDSRWSLSTSTHQLIDSKITRKIYFSPVLRNQESDITDSDGIEDNNTKKVTIVVTYPIKNGISTTTISTYVMNIFNN